MKVKFMVLIRSQAWKTTTIKGFKKMVIMFLFIEFLQL